MAQILGKFIADNAVNADKVKLQNAAYLKGRNNADNADVDLIRVNASDQVEFGSTPVVGADSVLISSDKGANNGVASLDGSGKLLTGQLPPLAITSTQSVADQPARLALAGSVQEGDVAVQLDTGATYILTDAGNGSQNSHWQEITATGTITSVNGQTGPTVTLTTTDISEGTNLYYTSARFDTDFSGKDTDDLSEGATNLYFTDARARTAAVEDQIIDGVTNIAPSQNVVFDELALKTTASELASTANGEGASLVGVEDAAANFTGTDVEAVLAELFTLANTASPNAENEVITLSAGDITAKGVTVSNTPISGSLHVVPVGGVKAEVGVDYTGSATTGSGTTISWTGLGFDGLLAAGDKLNVHYLY